MRVKKIYCLLETVEKAVCSAISVFVGQNLGAMKMVRIRKGMKSMTVFAFLFAAWLALVLLVFGDSLIGLFLNKNQDPADLKEAYRAARVYLNVQCVFYFFYGAHAFLQRSRPGAWGISGISYDSCVSANCRKVADGSAACSGAGAGWYVSARRSRSTCQPAGRCHTDFVFMRRLERE